MHLKRAEGMQFFSSYDFRGFRISDFDTCPEYIEGFGLPGVVRLGGGCFTIVPCKQPCLFFHLLSRVVPKVAVKKTTGRRGCGQYNIN